MSAADIRPAHAAFLIGFVAAGLVRFGATSYGWTGMFLVSCGVVIGIAIAACYWFDALTDDRRSDR